MAHHSTLHMSKVTLVNSKKFMTMTSMCNLPQSLLPWQLRGWDVCSSQLLRLPVKILITSKSHFAIRSDPIESKVLHYHYLDLPILRTLADLKYYHSHSVDFFLIILHLLDHMIISCRHPGCLTVEYTFVFIAIFSYLLCFTFSSVL